MSHSSLEDALKAQGFKMSEPNPEEESSVSIDQLEEPASVECDQALQRLKQYRPGNLLLEPGLFRPISPSGSSIFSVYHHSAGYPLLQWWGRNGIGLPVQGLELQGHLTDIDQVIMSRGFDAMPRCASFHDATHHLFDTARFVAERGQAERSGRAGHTVQCVVQLLDMERNQTALA